MPIRIYVLVGHANINSILLEVVTYPYSSCGSYRTFVIPIRSLLHANTVQCYGSMPTQVQMYGCGMVYI